MKKKNYMVILMGKEKAFGKNSIFVTNKNHWFFILFYVLQRYKGNSVGKGQSFPQMVPAQLVTHIPQANFDSCLTPHTNINSK